jgi:hypothetical protein
VKGRVILGLVGAVVLVLFVLGQLGLGDEETSPDPPGGLRSAEPNGVGAWPAVLGRGDVRLQIRDVDPDDLRLLPSTTYVFVERQLDRETAAEVVDGARRGARIIAAGPDAQALLRALDEPTASQPGGLGAAAPARRVAETAAVDRVARTGVVWEIPPEDLRSLLVLRPRNGGDGGVVAGDLRVGRGRIVLIPDRGVLENRGLVQADNAAFAVAVAGRGPLVALRFAVDSSVGGIPGRVVLVVLLLVLAAAAAMVARGRRLGPAVHPDSDPTPGRSGYVDALAAVLARTNDRAAAAERMRSRARSVLARRVGLGPDPGSDEVRSAALRAGLSESDAAALAGRSPSDAGPGAPVAPVDPHQLQAVGRALARLEGDTR